MSKSVLPLEMFYAFEKKKGNHVYLRQPLGRGVRRNQAKQWEELTWEQVGLEARRFAQALGRLPLKPQSKVAILSKNCAHWIIADLGIWMAGHVSVPLFPTLTGPSIQTILEHCHAEVCIAGKLDQWDTQKDFIPKRISVLSFPHWFHPGTVAWEEFLAGQSSELSSPVRAATDLATIIYTSGTTGHPKGVMHSFESMSAFVDTAIHSVGLTDQERFFSYLPLSHVAERLLVELGSLYTGGTVSFAESVESFKRNLKEVRPTVFLAVPRIWQKFQEGILQKIPSGKLNFYLALPFLNTWLKRKIKQELGLDQTKVFLTGAAAISKELLVWFDHLGIRIHEVYGMTENFCICSFNFPEQTRFGTLGVAFPGTEIKISDQGEILSRSRATMKGYYLEEALTRETIDSEGWLHTGDQGELSAEGFLRITGRVKDLFKTSKGKYVSPTKIEHLITSYLGIEHACVVGQDLPQPIALLVLSEPTKSLGKKELTVELSTLLNSVNQNVESYERLDRLVVLNEPWTVENGMLTPTLKLKRNVVERRYAPFMERWSLSKERIVFEKEMN